jgi:uncharacterized protein
MAIRFSRGAVHLACHVQPGVKAQRQGIRAVSSERVELCVAAAARDGEANKAVRELVASVSEPVGAEAQRWC